MTHLAGVQSGFFIVHHPNPMLYGSFMSVDRENVVSFGKAKDTSRPDCFSGTPAGRHHFNVRFESEGPVLRAQRSRTPTYVNESIVTEHVLKLGDVVRIGCLLLVFSVTCPNSDREGIPGLSAEAYRTNSRAKSIAKSTILVTLSGRTGTPQHALAQYIHQCSAQTGGFVALDALQMNQNTPDVYLADALRTGGELAQPTNHGSLFLFNADLIPHDTLLEVAHEHPAVRFIIGRTQHTILSDKVNTIVIPDLRTRREDILSCVHRFCLDLGYERVRINPELAVRLLGYNWPGNDEELKRVVTRLCTEKGDAQPWTLSSELVQRLSPSFVDARHAMKPNELPKEVLINSLRVHGGHIGLVAAEMNTSVEDIQRYINESNIDPSRFT